MPRSRWIDKSTATTYHLLHRPQHDPRIHDADASDRVLVPVSHDSLTADQSSVPQYASTASSAAESLSHRAHHIADLEAEYLLETPDEHPSSFDQPPQDNYSKWSIRQNEGEAAEHGIYYDDTNYDYMQHLRDVDQPRLSDPSSNNTMATQSLWIPAPQASQREAKGKARARDREKIGLDQAIAALDLDEAPPLHVARPVLETQQDVPDTLAGFQPEMDSRLREVLEALEDDAFVDADEDDDFFAQVAGDGREVTLDEFEQTTTKTALPEPTNSTETWAATLQDDDDDEGWASDHTEKPSYKPAATETATDAAVPNNKSLEPAASSAANSSAMPDATAADGDFMASFRTLPPSLRKGLPSAAYLTPSITTGASALISASGRRRRRRKGARTSSDAYSMTSSSLARTEGLTTLDARFERTLAAYEEENEDDEDLESRVTDNGDDDAVHDRKTSFEGDDNMSLAGVSTATGATGATGLSQASLTSQRATNSTMGSQSGQRSGAPILSQSAFDGILDEFLEQCPPQTQGRTSNGARRRPTRADRERRQVRGLQELDQVRTVLGRPSVPS